jgi:hypothetical protein
MKVKVTISKGGVIKNGTTHISNLQNLKYFIETLKEYKWVVHKVQVQKAL